MSNILTEALKELKESNDEYLYNAREFADSVKNMTVEEAEDWYYNQYKFDKLRPEDEAEELVCTALEDKIRLNEVNDDEINESLDDSIIELKEEDYTYDENDGTITVKKEILSRKPEEKEHFKFKFIEDNDDKVFVYSFKEETQDGYAFDYVADEEDFVTNESLNEGVTNNSKIDEYLEGVYRGGGWVTLYKIEEQDLLYDEDLRGATLEDVVKRALDKGFLLKETPEEGYAIVHEKFKNTKFEESFNLNESDKQAAISIDDAQKWVDYDMERYGEISDKTNELIKKARFQIIEDKYGDYEVAAGKYED